jgi:two-component system NtrC family sensor kinase
MADVSKTKRAAAAALLIDDYYELSHRILRLGNRGLPRGEFLREAFGLLIDASGCDAVEFRLRDGDFCYYAEMTGGGARNFRFGIIDGIVHQDGRVLPCADNDAPLERLCRDVMRGGFEAGQPCFTEKGTFWTGSAGKASVRGFSANGEASATPYLVGGNYGSLVAAPFAVGEEDVGLLLLKSRQENFFGRVEAEFFEGVAQNVGVAIADRRTRWRLGERVKEMTCLYGIAEVASRPGISAGEVFREIVGLLPPAMQYPDITVGKIVIDGVVYATEEGEDAPYKLSADIVVNGENRGTVEVQYKEAKLDYEPGIFLQEEQSLIDAIARQIGLILENRQAEEERFRLREQLRHADRLATIGQLAAGVAHELNEPLASVLSFAELLKEDRGLSAQGAKDLSTILTAALRARVVVRQLLFFAREVPTIKQAVDVGDVVAEALSLLQSRFDKENVKCELKLAPDLPKIVADPAQLHQVVVNLLVNALQAMPGGGRLTISTTADEEGVCFAVEDTGVGMSEEVKKNIFLPFFTTKEVGQGTGLGLPVVHGIVTAHGGSVSVETEPGRGSRFEVRLPRPAPEREERRGKSERG